MKSSLKQNERSGIRVNNLVTVVSWCRSSWDFVDRDVGKLVRMTFVLTKVLKFVHNFIDMSPICHRDVTNMSPICQQSELLYR